MTEQTPPSKSISLVVVHGVGDPQPGSHVHKMAEHLQLDGQSATHTFRETEKNEHKQSYIVARDDNPVHVIFEVNWSDLMPALKPPSPRDFEQYQSSESGIGNLIAIVFEKMLFLLTPILHLVTGILYASDLSKENPSPQSVRWYRGWLQVAFIWSAVLPITVMFPSQISVWIPILIALITLVFGYYLKQFGPLFFQGSLLWTVVLTIITLALYSETKAIMWFIHLHHITYGLLLALLLVSTIQLYGSSAPKMLKHSRAAMLTISFVLVSMVHLAVNTLFLSIGWLAQTLFKTKSETLKQYLKTPFLEQGLLVLTLGCCGFILLVFVVIMYRAKISPYREAHKHSSKQQQPTSGSKQKEPEAPGSFVRKLLKEILLPGIIIFWLLVFALIIHFVSGQWLQFPVDYFFAISCSIFVLGSIFAYLIRTEIVDRVGDVIFYITAHQPEKLSIAQRLRERIIDVLRKVQKDNPDCELVILAHSQGTIATIDALHESGVDKEFFCRLITIGSPIRSLYSNFLCYDPTVAPSLKSWTNLYFGEDYIGGRIQLDGVKDVPLHGGNHNDYWGWEEVLNEISPPKKTDQSNS